MKLSDDSLVGRDAIQKPKSTNNSPRSDSARSDSALRSVPYNFSNNFGTNTVQSKSDIEELNIREVFAPPKMKRWQSEVRKNQIVRITMDGAIPRAKTISNNRKRRERARKVREKIPQGGRDRMSDKLYHEQENFDNKQEDSVGLTPELQLRKSISSPMTRSSKIFYDETSKTEIKDGELWSEFNNKIEHHRKAINKKLVYNCQKVMDEYRQRLDEIDEFMEMWYTKEKDKTTDAKLKFIIDYTLKEFRVQFERMKKESNKFANYNSGLEIPSYLSRKV